MRGMAGQMKCLTWRHGNRWVGLQETDAYENNADMQHCARMAPNRTNTAIHHRNESLPRLQV